MQDERKSPASAEPGSEKRNDRMPKGLVAVAVLHGILALGLGCNGLQLLLRWHELTFGEVMIMLLCFPISALSAVSGRGLWLRKPYGRVAAFFVGWVVALVAGILFWYSRDSSWTDGAMEATWRMCSWPCSRFSEFSHLVFLL